MSELRAFFDRFYETLTLLKQRGYKTDFEMAKVDGNYVLIINGLKVKVWASERDVYINCEFLVVPTLPQLVSPQGLACVIALLNLLPEWVQPHLKRGRIRIFRVYRSEVGVYMLFGSNPCWLSFDDPTKTLQEINFAIADLFLQC